MRILPLLFCMLGLCSAANAGTVPDYITAAVADPHRPHDEVSRDQYRKPGEVIAVAGIKPGDRIGEIMPGGGYFTRIFSRVVGPSGRVYAFVPTEQITCCSPQESDGARLVAKDPYYKNVVLDVAPVSQYGAREPLDVVWTSQNYHDLHDTFMGPADLTALNKQVFKALKPGGVYFVIDHAAVPGSGLRDTNALHRIDPESIIHEVEAAGFKLETSSDLLRNPDDTHKLPIFDAQIRGRTDEAVLKFHKPE
jgi:predicted methyltransferase